MLRDRRRLQCALSWLTVLPALLLGRLIVSFRADVIISSAAEA